MALPQARAQAQGTEGWQRYSAQFPEVVRLIEQAQPQAALAWMGAHEASYGDDAGFYYLHGLLHMHQSHALEAAEAFERAVLIEPEHAAAWLELALAHAALGHESTAASYFDYIETHFAPPLQVRTRIDRARQALHRAHRASGWQVQGEVIWGRDSNANSGLSDSVIPVTLGSERVDLQLDPAYQARQDDFLHAQVQARTRWQVAGQAVDVDLGFKDRQYRTEHAFSSVDITTGLSLPRQHAWGESVWAAHAEYYNLGGRGLLHNTRISAMFERPIQHCRLGTGLEQEWRRYISLVLLNANVSWWQAGLACEGQWRGWAVHSAWIWREGIDHPDGARAGGQTRRSELIAQLGWALPYAMRLDASVGFARAADRDGYSPLLENNTPRVLERRSLRVLWSLPLGEDWGLAASVELNRIDANLALFRQHGRVLGMHLNRRF